MYLILKYEKDEQEVEDHENHRTPRRREVLFRKNYVKNRGFCHAVGCLGFCWRRALASACENGGWCTTRVLRTLAA